MNIGAEFRACTSVLVVPKDSRLDAYEGEAVQPKD